VLLARYRVTGVINTLAESGFFRYIAYKLRQRERLKAQERSVIDANKQIAELIAAKKDEILRIAAKHGARNVRVFGSAARGEATPGSDVDILVDMERGRTLLDLGGLLMELRDLLGVDVDVVTEHGLKPRIREQVLKEAQGL
jgi:predicted nucleotidyltransferase